MKRLSPQASNPLAIREIPVFPTHPASAPSVFLACLAFMAIMALGASLSGCLDSGSPGPQAPGPGVACPAGDSLAEPPATGPWKRVLCQAQFPGRMRANLAVLGNRLWLLGGQAEDGFRFDAWSTADGIAWRKETDSLPFGPAVEFKVAVHGGALWALTTRADSEAYANDIWTSADGAAWTRVAADAMSFRWGGTRGSAFASFGGRLWVVWGVPLNGSGESMIFSSADGVAWRPAAGAPLSGSLQRTGAAVLNGSLWLLGGDAVPNVSWYSDQTWRTDGQAWINVPSDTGVLPRYDFALAAHDGRLWVAGGAATASAYDPAGARADEVWSSADGQAWRLDDEHAPFRKRAGAAAISFNGWLWIVGGGRMALGEASPPFLNDVWYREEVE